MQFKAKSKRINVFSECAKRIISRIEKLSMGPLQGKRAKHSKCILFEIH